ncbi:MAG: hypothetical protein J4O02_02565 [Chloroflexi bacterium]|nr:hypothetical protein [Chloroflexota bacterium]
MKKRRTRCFSRFSALALALVAVMLGVACGSGQSLPPTLAVEAADFSFNLPASIQGGLTRIELTNVGQEPHHMQILRLNDGVSQEQFQTILQGVIEAMSTEGEAAISGIFQAGTAAGGPASVVPGDETTVVLDLIPGQYALLCFIASADGVPHFAKGMASTIEVTAAPESASIEPEEDATVTLNDFAFVGVPATLPAGVSTLKIVNAGQEDHEMTLLRLDGVTMKQAVERLMTPQDQRPPGPRPFEFAGGFQAILPGQSGWSILDLEPGEYGLVCFVPSAANGFAPHFALGMFGSFTVK